MATTLKAKVDLDISLAEKKLKALEKRINQINKGVNQEAKVQKQVEASVTRQNTLHSKIYNWLSLQRTKIQEQGRAWNNNLRTIRDVDDLYSDMLGKLRSIAGVALGIQGIKLAMETSDVITSAENKLTYINGGDEAASQASLDKIYAASMRSRSNYADMIGNVSKSMMLAPEAFKGNVDNAIRFQETMAKSFAIGGANPKEISSALLQLTQGLSSGVLQGEELKAVRESAPLAAKAIEAYAQKVYNTTKTLKELGAEGLLTSDIVVAAMMDASEGVDGYFTTAKITFQQTKDMVKNLATKTFEPVLQRLNDVLNQLHESGLMQVFTDIFTAMAEVGNILLTILGGVATWIAENWEGLKHIILPILQTILIGVLVLIPAFALLKAVMFTVGIVSSIAMLPLGKTLLIIAGVLMVLGMLVSWLGLTFQEVCGIIVGAIMVAVAAIWNVIAAVFNFVIDGFVVIWNFIGSFVNFIYRCFEDPVKAVKLLFYDLFDTVLSIVEAIASAIDTVFGSELAVDVRGWRDDMGKYVEENYGDAPEIMEKLDATSLHLGRFEYGDAYDMGYEFGYGVGDKISSFFGDVGSITNDPANGLNLDDYSGLLGGIKDDTGNISDSMDISEDLDYLKDLAERDTINRFTTAEIIVDMKNNNTISKDMDIDGVVSKLSERLYEELGVVAAGVHY